MSWRLTELDTEELVGLWPYLHEIAKEVAEAQAKKLYLHMDEPCGLHAWGSGKAPHRYSCPTCMQQLRVELGLEG